MVNYQNGKIYKITSKNTPKFYIGSTCQSLNKRLSLHRTSHHNCKSNEIIELGEEEIILIENFPCNSRKELETREAELIKENGENCINQNMPRRTEKERYDNNINGRADKQRENQRRFRAEQPDRYKEIVIKTRAKNKEKIRERKKIKIMCACGIEYCKDHKARHEKSNYHKKSLVNI